jgi:hypothetical protein
LCFGVLANVQEFCLEDDASASSISGIGCYPDDPEQGIHY